MVKRGVGASRVPNRCRQLFFDCASAPLVTLQLLSVPSNCKRLPVNRPSAFGHFFDHSRLQRRSDSVGASFRNKKKGANPMKF